MSDSPDISTHAQKILRNSVRFVQHVRAAQGSFYLDTIHTNDGRGPFVAEWALHGPSGTPRVRLVCGSRYALVVPIHMRHMPSSMADAFAEMFGIASSSSVAGSQLGRRAPTTSAIRAASRRTMVFGAALAPARSASRPPRTRRAPSPSTRSHRARR